MLCIALICLRMDHWKSAISSPFLLAVQAWLEAELYARDGGKCAQMSVLSCQATRLKGIGCKCTAMLTNDASGDILLGACSQTCMNTRSSSANWQMSQRHRFSARHVFSNHFKISWQRSCLCTFSNVKQDTNAVLSSCLVISVRTTSYVSSYIVGQSILT